MSFLYQVTVKFTSAQIAASVVGCVGQKQDGTLIGIDGLPISIDGLSFTAAQTLAGAVNVYGETTTGVMLNGDGETVLTKSGALTEFPGSLTLSGFTENVQAPSVTTLSNSELRIAKPVVNSVGTNSFLGYTNTSSASWASGVATIICTSTHNYRVGQLFTLLDVVPSGYNTTARITAVPTSTSYTFDLVSNPGNYVSGGYTVLNPDVQFRPSGPRVPALALCSDPDSVSLGYDDVPVFLITDSDGNKSNKSIAFSSDGHTMFVRQGGVLKRFVNGTRDIVVSSYVRGWSNSPTANPSDIANVDLGYGRYDDGIFEVNNGTPGTIRDIKVRSAIQSPPASITPVSNGDFVFEATSNTSVTMKLKGSDGIVRSAIIVLT